MIVRLFRTTVRRPFKVTRFSPRVWAVEYGHSVWGVRFGR
jgi:hypothetical protein